MIRGLVYWSVLVVAVSGIPASVIGHSGEQIASAITLQWDPNVDPPAGYLVYVGAQPDRYDAIYDVGNSTEFNYSTGVPGQRYYFAVAASDPVPSNVGPMSGDRVHNHSGCTNDDFAVAAPRRRRCGHAGMEKRWHPGYRGIFPRGWLGQRAEQSVRRVRRSTDVAYCIHRPGKLPCPPARTNFHRAGRRVERDHVFGRSRGVQRAAGNTNWRDRVSHLRYREASMDPGAGRTSYYVLVGSSKGRSDLFVGNVGPSSQVAAQVPARFKALARVVAINACGHSEPSSEVRVR